MESILNALNSINFKMKKIKILKHDERLTKKSLSKILKKLNVSVEDLDKDEYF